VLDLELNGYLHKNAVVVDIGSGTGISTELFLSQGYSCIGVEPNLEMRTAGERQLASYNEFQSINGSAESTGLEPESVDLIISGQAFHWFDRIAAKIEFHRILRPGGKVALIWNKRHHTGSQFQADYENLLQEYCNDYAQVDYKNVDDTAIDNFFAPLPHAVYEYLNQQHFNLEGLKGRLLSSSYCPVEGEPNYKPVMTGLATIFAAYQIDGEVTFDYRTSVYVGQLKPND
jgi:SAM-dependent methyltransferase